MASFVGTAAAGRLEGRPGTVLAAISEAATVKPVAPAAAHQVNRRRLERPASRLCCAGVDTVGRGMAAILRPDPLRNRDEAGFRPSSVGPYARGAPPLGAAPWWTIEVRHCTEIDGHWEAGCRFVPVPPVQVLMQFG